MYKFCCFIGHRKIERTEELICLLKIFIEFLIVSENVAYFIFGSKSEFDELCCEIVDELKVKYPHIKKILFTCKGEGGFLENETKERECMEKYLSKFYKKEIHVTSYDEIIKLDKIYSAGKASYIERNQAMIDKSDFCVFYYDENYIPPLKSNRKWHNVSNSGTKLAFDYAKQKKKKIYNLFKQ